MDFRKVVKICRKHRLIKVPNIGWAPMTESLLGEVDRGVHSRYHLFQNSPCLKCDSEAKKKIAST